MRERKLLSAEAEVAGEELNQAFASVMDDLGQGQTVDPAVVTKRLHEFACTCLGLTADAVFVSGSVDEGVLELSIGFTTQMREEAAVKEAAGE